MSTGQQGVCLFEKLVCNKWHSPNVGDTLINNNIVKISKENFEILSSESEARTRTRTLQIG